MSYPPPPGYPPGYPGGYPAPRGTNAWAVAALVCAFLFAPLGIVFGHVSLSQIKRTGEEGRGLAIAGLVIGYVMTAVTIVVVVFGLLFLMAVAERIDDVRVNDGSTRVTAAPGRADRLPEFVAPKNLGANCQYPKADVPAGAPVTPPRSGRVPTEPAQISASVSTDQGDIGLQLDNGKSPCTVNNFASLAQQGFFDNTTCHRLTTARAMKVLQCGDPTGTGAGGPGYRFPNEYPSSQYRLSDPGLRRPVVYPRGTLVMANNGPGTNGSQFFLVYGDTHLPPTYTVFGTIDATGLATLDKIAARGVAGGGDDGKPAAEVTITSARLD
ncbi:peptidylprolyl isomerase [Mycolicibacterium litorale]|uniref:Cyclophilin n=1 Tax=Mycolicibacterium litorale TaxID=758802 RepID=A0AAD1IKC9_9MYCO|nr:peptidylprolyl isomerase [Mycolicibacterium litorale]MCV7415201.1 peptidylprolyl isomerase [Mycolicibacterium litorale]TDY08453.1 peptidyl-prolyl cis-trans isomerase B (cyclophilin B) [Mycolicibacterium litorale]BBY16376.1 cyclophilin [Mycolicibacterium litorale]